MATETQTMANQKNAQLSTGPKNTTKTCKNAQKYGIFAKEIVVNCPYFQENKKEFYYILTEFVEEYQPQTITEWVLIEEVVDAYWRLKRIRKARQADIKMKMVDLPKETIENIEDTDMLKQLTAHDIDGKINNMSHSEIKSILEKRTKTLENLEKNILSETEIDELLLDFDKSEVPENVLTLPLEEKKKLLESLYQKYCDFYWALDFIKTKQEEELIKWRKEIALCDFNWENLSAYETTLEKKFYRAIAMLRQIKRGLV